MKPVWANLKQWLDGIRGRLYFSNKFILDNLKVEREDYVEFAKVQMNHYNFPAHAGSKKKKKKTHYICLLKRSPINFMTETNDVKF